MDIRALEKSLENCPCGKKHTAPIKAVEIGRGLLSKTAGILKDNGFPGKILVVADKNTLAAADGILEVLADGGFTYKLKQYENLRTAEMTEVNNIVSLAEDVQGILSVGTGSLNDICRLASKKADKEFAIFATAPSMDGFASHTAPITDNNFKISYTARLPSVIIGDTEILAKAPAELKSAGFGDMIAKYVALVDWRISSLVTGEPMCPAVAEITKRGLMRAVELADRVTSEDPETAGAIMEGLVLTGIAMTLGDTTRAASGTEHIISHFWECKKLENGEISDYHGKKVGVATLLTAKLYEDLVSHEKIYPTTDTTDWDKVYAVYGENFRSDIEKMNNPTITDGVSPELLGEKWSEIREIVKNGLPSFGEMLELMNKAGAAKTLSDIAVTHELGLAGFIYHPYMRHRMTLARLVPMLGITPDYQRLLRCTEKE